MAISCQQRLPADILTFSVATILSATVMRTGELIPVIAERCLLVG
jgi:hypothetical protein